MRMEKEEGQKVKRRRQRGQRVIAGLCREM